MFCSSQKSKCKDLPKFEFGGGRGCSVVVKTQSAKICLNLNFRRGGGRCSVIVKTQSAKICLTLNWGGCSVVVRTQNAKIWPNGGGGGRGGVLYQIPEQGLLANLVKKILEA